MHKNVEKVIADARAVRIEVGEEEVLFIGIDPGRMPPNIFKQYQDNVKDTFKQVLPEEVKVVCGPKSMDFVVIGKKSAFKEKLKGTVK